MDDWQPGDLALCINDKEYPGEVGRAEWDPEVGGVYHVSIVRLHARTGVVALSFAEDPLGQLWGYPAPNFTKIRPLTEEEKREALEEIEQDKRVPAKVN